MTPGRPPEEMPQRSIDLGATLSPQARRIARAQAASLW